MKRESGLLLLLLIFATTLPLNGQAPAAKLEGMWSDAPATAVGTFCLFVCTDFGLERLKKLLDDPKNDSKPTMQLIAEAKTAESEYIKARLTPEALKHYPLDPLKDPGYLQCEPWGVARQMFAPHQFELRQRGKDRIELHYGEWDQHRTVYMDGRKLSDIKPSRLGSSVGRWEGDTLVVETAGITANIFEAPFGAAAPQGGTFHSDRLRITERFARSADGKTLQLTARLEDPATFTEPLTLKKVWAWAPDQKIAPYDSCEKPTEGKKGGK